MPLRSACLSVVVGGLLAAPALADVVHLKKGGRVEGAIVSEDRNGVTLDVSMGRITIPMQSVLRVEKKTSALSEFRRRLDALDTLDLRAHIELARFATDQALRGEAKAAWARVLDLDPGNAEAHRQLGHVVMDGVYMDEDQANRARGLVHFDGRWMTPEEQASLLREREMRALDERRIAESRRRERDAETRAERAEAEAARERAAAQRTTGFPVYGGFVGGGPVWVGGGNGCWHEGCVQRTDGGWRQAPPPQPPARPRPVVSKPRASIN